MVCYPLHPALIDTVDSWIRAELGRLADRLIYAREIETAQFMLSFYGEACGPPSIRSIRRLQREDGVGLLDCMKLFSIHDGGFFPDRFDF